MDNQQRYVPSSGGVYDRVNDRHNSRDYNAPEILDLCAWLNDRQAGYAPKLGANR